MITIIFNSSYLVANYYYDYDVLCVASCKELVHTLGASTSTMIVFIHALLFYDDDDDDDDDNDNDDDIAMMLQ
jgi:hypothetical protein